MLNCKLNILEVLYADRNHIKLLCMAKEQRQVYIVEGTGQYKVKYCMDNWSTPLFLKCELKDKRTLEIIDLLHKDKK